MQKLNVNKLHPHPDNPRKDLGDLTELAKSIKVIGCTMAAEKMELLDGSHRLYRKVDDEDEGQ